MDRRTFIKLGAVTSSLALAPTLGQASQTFQTKAKIVIVGVGAAGISVSNRLSQQFEGAEIILLGKNKQHVYQPGLTLVMANLWSSDQVITQTARWIPEGVKWIDQDVDAFDPDAKKITLTDGTSMTYDILVVATGCQLNYDQIEGMEVDLIGKQGIGSVYAGPTGAAKTFTALDTFITQGEGNAVFTLPKTPLKCAGAPLKISFISLDKMERSGRRDKFDAHFFTPYPDRVFSVKVYNEFVMKRWEEQNLTLHREHQLIGIDPGNKTATFKLADESTKKVEYGFIHVVPPMSAPNAVMNSPLVWQEGPFQGKWVEVDQHTLQHKRYPDVFALGDVIGVPLGKTAASVKHQVPIMIQNMANYLSAKPLSANYNGYTSCPLITAIGKAILAEFGYNEVLLPSFAFVDPLKESWFAWMIEEKMLQPAYYAMLRGKI